MSYNVKRGTQQATVEVEANAFRTFEDLEVYKTACEFRKKMYGVACRLPTSKNLDWRVKFVELPS
jgi:hypothetical protein